MIHGRNIFALGLIPIAGAAVGCSQEEARPNILIAIADDQSYPYASAYGSTTVSTPAFDYVASHGILFENAYSTSPGSSPSRASLLTGLFPWQVVEAGTHASSFPSEYLCFPDVFAEAGYASGYTGKGWGPGDWRVSGRRHNPAGPEYNELKCDPPYSGISKIDYAANFARFLDSRQQGQPFCFWYGSHEPHRPYELDSWERAGRDVADAEVPGFLPDTEIVRGDIMDYAVEISWFDGHLMACIEALRERRLLDNTIIIVTADNGMSFPHAKANCYDAGVHVPLAICWGDKIKGRGLESALVSLVDIFPTLLDLTGVRMEGTDLSGESLAPLLGIGPEDMLRPRSIADVRGTRTPATAISAIPCAVYAAGTICSCIISALSSGRPEIPCHSTRKVVNRTHIMTSMPPLPSLISSNIAEKPESSRTLTRRWPCVRSTNCSIWPTMRPA